MVASARISKVLVVVIAVAVTFFLYTGYTGYHDYGIPLPSGSRISRPLGHAINTSGAQHQHLLDLKLTDPFEYRRQCIKPHQTSKLVRSRGSAFSTDSLLLTEPTTHSISDLGTISNVACHQPLVLDVPASHVDGAGSLDPATLMLGAVTTLERLTTALPEWAGFLAGTGVLIAVMLRDQHDSDSPAVASARDSAHRLGITVELVCQAELLPAGETDWPTEFSEAQSNFEIALAFDKFKRPETKWFGVIDDDTFINSVPDLLRSIGQYDPSESYYVGYYPESTVSTWFSRLYATGGGGFFVSLPLLDQILSNFKTCLLDYQASWGDELWGYCILDHTSTGLTVLDGLHQLELRGEMAGWYESGAWPVLTVHHWRSMHKCPIPQVHMVTEIAGTDSFLSRYVFKDDKTVLTNGYSIVHYPRGVPNLSQAELTWEAPNKDIRVAGNFWHGLGDLRSQLPKEEKESWLLEHATSDGTEVKQVYIRRGSVDSVIELDWSLSY